MYTDSLYLTLSGKDLYDCMRSTKKQQWNSLRGGDCTNKFSAKSTTVVFPRTCCAKHKKHDRQEPGLFKEEFSSTEMICLCSKTYCCYDSQSNKIEISSGRRPLKRTLEDYSDGLTSRYRKVSKRLLTSTNRCFRTTKHTVATHERTKKGLS